VEAELLHVDRQIRKTNFIKILSVEAELLHVDRQIRQTNFMKIHPVEAELLHVDRRTDKGKTNQFHENTSSGG
jgi:hypothetical protein